jgi:hypothetical protein
MVGQQRRSFFQVTSPAAKMRHRLGDATDDDNDEPLLDRDQQ